VRSPFNASAVGIVLSLGSDECGILADLLQQLDGLLEPEPPVGAVDNEPAGGETLLDPFAAIVASLDIPTGPPADPAVARLLPAGHRDDPEVAADFRRLSEATVRDRKRRNASLARDALSRPAPVVLDQGEALALMKSLTDVRLVLATRLDLNEEGDVERLAEAVREIRNQAVAAEILGTLGLYELLGWWQECLIRAVSSGK